MILIHYWCCRRPSIEQLQSFFVYAKKLCRFRGSLSYWVQRSIQLNEKEHKWCYVNLMKYSNLSVVLLGPFPRWKPACTLCARWFRVVCAVYHSNKRRYRRNRFSTDFFFPKIGHGGFSMVYSSSSWSTIISLIRNK